jgi:hypothetical protein
VDLKKPRNVGRGFAAANNHFSDFGLLLRRKFGTSATNSPFPTRDIQPSFGTLAKHGALKFSECSHHLHHHPASCRSCVDRFGETSEACLGCRKSFHYCQHISQGPGQAV